MKADKKCPKCPKPAESKPKSKPIDTKAVKDRQMKVREAVKAKAMAMAKKAGKAEAIK